ncbi:hypothetical protein F9C28_03205 [Shimwellia pseudoproteus]|nr:hypothetical protein [Shimwellia pseudoproteus]
MQHRVSAAIFIEAVANMNAAFDNYKPSFYRSVTSVQSLFVFLPSAGGVWQREKGFSSPVILLYP